MLDRKACWRWLVCQKACQSCWETELKREEREDAKHSNNLSWSSRRGICLIEKGSGNMSELHMSWRVCWSCLLKRPLHFPTRADSPQLFVKCLPTKISNLSNNAPLFHTLKVNKCTVEWHMEQLYCKYAAHFLSSPMCLFSQPTCTVSHFLILALSFWFPLTQIRCLLSMRTSSNPQSACMDYTSGRAPTSALPSGGRRMEGAQHLCR